MDFKVGRAVSKTRSLGKTVETSDEHSRVYISISPIFKKLCQNDWLDSLESGQTV